jgi:hypothetical protein
MIYTNTASVFEKVLSELTTAMEGPQVTAVLLTCSDATAGNAGVVHQDI